MSGTLDSRSKRAVAMLLSTSEGLAREGELGAILFKAWEDMIVDVKSKWGLRSCLKIGKILRIGEVGRAICRVCQDC